MKIVRLYDRFEKSVSVGEVARGVGQVHWDKESIVMGEMTFQELKRFFQSIKFRAGDKIRLKKNGEAYPEIFVVDFSHEAYFCVDGAGNNYVFGFSEVEADKN